MEELYGHNDLFNVILNETRSYPAEMPVTLNLVVSAGCPPLTISKVTIIHAAAEWYLLNRDQDDISVTNGPAMLVCPLPTNPGRLSTAFWTSLAEELVSFRDDMDSLSDIVSRADGTLMDLTASDDNHARTRSVVRFVWSIAKELRAQLMLRYQDDPILRSSSDRPGQVRALRLSEDPLASWYRLHTREMNGGYFDWNSEVKKKKPLVEPCFFSGLWSSWASENMAR
jgi:hypothetical protein